MTGSGSASKLDSRGDMDQLVRDYLTAKGYLQAVNALDAERLKHQRPAEDLYAPTLQTDVAQTSLTTVRTLLQNPAQSLFVVGIHDGDINVYVSEYNRLHHWISQSLDIVQPYMTAIGFVAFIQCYVALIRSEHTVQAQQLWSEYHEHYQSTFEEELQSMSQFLAPSQEKDEVFVDANPFVRGILSPKKTLVLISSLAFRLLSNYLSDNELVLIAAIINDKIRFDKSPYSDTQTDVNVNQLVVFPEYTQLGVVQTSGKEINWNVPGNQAVLKAWKERGPTTASTSFLSATTCDNLDDNQRKWIMLFVRPRGVLERSRKRKMAGINTDPFTPLCTVEASSETSAATETAANSSGNTIGDALDPSVLFSTIGNTYEGMQCVAMNADMTQIVSGHRDSIVRVWRLDAQDKNDQTSDPFFGRSLRVYGNRSQWALDDVRPQLPIKQNSTGTDVQQTSATGQSSASSQQTVPYPMLELVGHDLPVFAVDQSASGRLIASSSADETIRLWDVSVTQCVSKIPMLSVAWDIKFHPLDYYLGAALANHSCSLFTTDRTTPIRLFTGHSSDVNCLNWHANGLYMASGSGDKSARVWDIRTAASVRLLKGASSALSAVSFGTSGHLLATGADNGHIHLWDLRGSMQKELAVLHGHSGAVYSLAFNNDGTVLYSGGRDCSVRVWDLTAAAINTLAYSSVSPLSTETPSQGVTTKNARVDTSAHHVLQPRHSFFTKASPVFHIGCTNKNLVYAVGPCSLNAATYPLDSDMHQAKQSALSREKEMLNLLQMKGVKTI